MIKNRSNRANLRLQNLWSHKVVKGVGKVAQGVNTPISQLILQQITSKSSTNGNNPRNTNFYLSKGARASATNNRESARQTQFDSVKTQSSGLKNGPTNMQRISMVSLANKPRNLSAFTNKRP